MANAPHHLAQFNVARMRGEITDPVMADFFDNLERINSAGEQAEGFVWRFKTDEGDATSVRIYDDTYLVINMSVWTTIDSLFRFAYQGAHVDFFRRRREWFEKLEVPTLVLWWVPAGHEPTPQEGKDRLEYLSAHGATPHAFTFRQRFEAGYVVE